MRRHLSATLSVLILAASAASVGVANAAPGPHTAVKMAAGSTCNPVASFCFRPSAKTIASGTKVTWKNTTIAPHTVTRCTAAACAGASGGTGTDAGFGSGTVVNGGKYKFVFHGAGTYTYYCTIHGFALMHGTITVTS